MSESNFKNGADKEKTKNINITQNKQNFIVETELQALADLTDADEQAQGNDKKKKKWNNIKKY